MTPILMRIIPVTTFPLAASYDSFEAAIAGARTILVNRLSQSVDLAFFGDPPH